MMGVSFGTVYYQHHDAPWKSVTPQFQPLKDTSFVSSVMLKCCLRRCESLS